MRRGARMPPRFFVYARRAEYSRRLRASVARRVRAAAAPSRASAFTAVYASASRMLTLPSMNDDMMQAATKRHAAPLL